MDLIRKANDLGFIAVGFSPPGRPPFFDYLRTWISEGKHAGMAWMERHLNLREDPAMLLEDCRTVITLAYPYSSRKPCTPEGLCAARYSEPQKEDYHDRLKKQAKILVKVLQEHFPGSRSRVCVDSAPIMERSLACKSGIGFIGKNTQLIIPGHGSYVFLAEILSTAVIHFPGPRPIENRCGSCTRCLEACPTGALEAPFRLNAGKCLSYLTIEKKKAVDGETGKKMGDCFFGCDACQEVCPFNQTHEMGEVILPSANDILDMDEKRFREIYGKSAFARAGLGKIQSNIQAMYKGRQAQIPKSLNPNAA